MGPHPFVVDVPHARYFVNDHCANCLVELPELEDALFCSNWCSEIAGQVRYLRGVFRDDRINDPAVKEAIGTRNAFLLIGGYRALGRQVNSRTREQVVNRAGGKCQTCGQDGTDVDHISGNSNEADNLQLLCNACHRAKTAEQLRPASEANQTLLLALVAGRVLPSEPILLADDQEEWSTRWRALKASQLRRYVEAAREGGFDPPGFKTRSSVATAREAFRAEASRRAQVDAEVARTDFFERLVRQAWAEQ
ncbi:HNH endonuclease [Leifsonia sp. NPDC056665]|uniref:HNH endonuclease n=1 Tax=Leifsonia sp. NPDC056665 TaxID=3345901 RepID=UPI0036951AD9